MQTLTILLAGIRIAVIREYEYTVSLLKDYISAGEIDFSVSASAEDTAWEQENAKGAFPMCYCESPALLRKISDRMIQYQAFLFHASAHPVA